MANKEALFTSKSDEYGTPPELFEGLDDYFHFTLDPSATPANAKCEDFFTMEDDGLKQSWSGEIVFCNPPYSQLGKWIEKAFQESLKDDLSKVMLIPARTDTIAFSEYCSKAAKIFFIKGRLKFLVDGEVTKNSATFPSAIIVFNSQRQGNRQVFWSNRDFTEIW